MGRCQTSMIELFKEAVNAFNPFIPNAPVLCPLKTSESTESMLCSIINALQDAKYVSKKELPCASCPLKGHTCLNKPAAFL